MIDYNASALALDRFAIQFKSILDLAEGLKTVGSLDQAATEAEARRATALAEVVNIATSRDAAQADLTVARKQRDDVIADATSKAADILGDARTAAQDLAARADAAFQERTAAADQAAESMTNMAVIAVSAARASEQAALDAVAVHTAARDALLAEIAELNGKLADVKAHIHNFIKA